MQKARKIIDYKLWLIDADNRLVDRWSPLRHGRLGKLDGGWDTSKASEVEALSSGIAETVARPGKYGKLRVCRFVHLADIVPEDWKDWFYTGLTTVDPGFAWGGNNRTMVGADRLLEAAKEVIDLSFTPPVELKERKEIEAFLKVLVDLRNTFIDLEH
jgi:hypothetical protein